MVLRAVTRAATSPREARCLRWQALEVSRARLGSGQDLARDGGVLREREDALRAAAEALGLKDIGVGKAVRELVARGERPLAKHLR